MIRHLLAGLVLASLSVPAPCAPSDGQPLMVAILWNQHLPAATPPAASGEFAAPWVRLHTARHLYGMAAMLSDHPDIHLTFNLTPTLLLQIESLVERWRAGEPTDSHVRLTLKDAATLTDDEKVFLLRHFFDVGDDRTLARHLRLVQLRDMRLGTSEESLAEVISTWTDQDFRDLQMLFNLAWTDAMFHRGVVLPDGTQVRVGEWVERGRDFTEDDKRALIDIHFRILGAVIPLYRRAQERGQIEISTTPLHHPILPLLIDTEITLDASPDLALPNIPLKRPDDAGELIERSAELYHAYFGRRPRGLWPAEGAVSSAMIPLLSNAGFAWFASDVDVLARTLGDNDPPARDRFTAWRSRAGGRTVSLLFRDTDMSERIASTYVTWDSARAAQDFIDLLHSVRVVAADEDGGRASQRVVFVAVNGLTCWKGHPDDGRPFLESLYTQLADDPLLDTVTVSECLARSGELPLLENLRAGSWVDGDFRSWIGEPEENRAWELLADARQSIGRAEIADPGADARAHELLLAAESSDWFWWFGNDHNGEHDGAFAEAFRETLRQAFMEAGLRVPLALEAPESDASGGD
jgi:alpha-amylase/alpha-mannosidase (GH57 family)